MAERKYNINGRMVTEKEYLEWQSFTPAERKHRLGIKDTTGSKPDSKEVKKIAEKRTSYSAPVEESESGTLEEFGEIIRGGKSRAKKSPQYERMMEAVKIAKRRRGQ